MHAASTSQQMGHIFKGIERPEEAEWPLHWDTAELQTQYGSGQTSIEQ